jgi:hypothetical protein
MQKLQLPHEPKVYPNFTQVISISLTNVDQVIKEGQGYKKFMPFNNELKLANI